MLSMADAQAIKPLSKTRWSRRAQCEGKLLVLQLLTQCRSFIDLEGDKISQVYSAKSMLLMHITYRLRSDTVDMSLTEQNSFSNVLASLLVNCLGGLSKLAGKEYTTYMKIAVLLFKTLVLPRWQCRSSAKSTRVTLQAQTMLPKRMMRMKREMSISLFVPVLMV